MALTLKELYLLWEWRTPTHQLEGECQNHVTLIFEEVLYFILDVILFCITAVSLY